MIFAGLTLPRTSGLSLGSSRLFSRPLTAVLADYSLSYYFFLWFTVLTLALVFIFAHGIEYVSWPRLVPLTSTIYYNGPGFRSANKGKGFGIPALDLAMLKAGAGAKARLLSETHRRAKSRLMDEVEMGTKERLD